MERARPPFRCPFGCFWIWWGCQSLSAKNDYQIGYLTQDPDFDDSKTVLDTVLSSDLKGNPAHSWVWNWSCSTIVSDKQARLERVMAEMDSPSLGNWESGQDGSQQAGIQDLSTLLGIVRWSEKTGSVGTSLTWQSRPLLFGWADQPSDIATIEWLTLFWKIQRRPSFYYPRSLFPRCSVNSGFSSWTELDWQSIKGIIRTMFA